MTSQERLYRLAELEKGLYRTLEVLRFLNPTEYLANINDLAQLGVLLERTKQRQLDLGVRQAGRSLTEKAS